MFDKAGLALHVFSRALQLKIYTCTCLKLYVFASPRARAYACMHMHVLNYRFRWIMRNGAGSRRTRVGSPSHTRAHPMLFKSMPGQRVAIAHTVTAVTVARVLHILPPPPRRRLPPARRASQRDACA